MTNWKEYKLGELVAVNERSIGRNFEFKSIEYIDTSSVTENKFETPTYTTISEAPSRAKRLIANGDTIISTVRPIQKHYGFIKEAKGNQVVSTGFAVVTPKRIEPHFLYYFLTQAEITEFLNTIAEGGTTTFPAFKADELKDLPINLPDYNTQTAIAEILSSLDDKIELNNKLNQELENLAQTLFKQWFIDFEFPANLADSTLSGVEGYKSSGGEMVDSELGEIPKGWEVKTLKDEFNLNMGQSPKGDTYNDIGEGIIFFQGRSDFGFRFPSVRKYTSDPKKVANKFETLISVRAPVGDINMAETECCIGRGLGSISHPKSFFSYTYYKMLSIQDELKSYDNEGTVFGSINKETLGNIKIIIPPLRIAEEFNNLIVDKDSLVYNLSCENQELTNLRDTLLPKLISGELEVNNVNFKNH
jgi:type I restriction enzyme, S subunit